MFDSSIEVPVTIRDPDQPIGTHIFTAMARNNDGSLRWTEVTIDDGDNAIDSDEAMAMDVRDGASHSSAASRTTGPPAFAECRKCRKLPVAGLFETMFATQI